MNGKVKNTIGIGGKTSPKEAGAKESAAASQLLALLESRYAMRVLWALRDGHAQTFRLLQDSVGGITPNTLNTRLKELRAAGLLHHDNDGYLLTATGLELSRRLAEVTAYAPKLSASQGRAKPR
ncbi:transcriptional regulator [Hylemonella gracilis str. Niagara R]|uniref:Transcriptional regulator n=1 Tax=Hylemonella gracilis str. Niagara R TaxID=1458275 RepID=A0A016XGY7_9BURK|nr:winged helix-turn-helix transcriptional regulator [Hylemonella gracilis]EYC50842.1 transcriptional regulator [Hylemonella gracilis str. Niagara R]